MHKWEASLKDTPSSGQPGESSPNARKLRRKTHQIIKRVTDSFETLQFNTPVAALMELSNAIGDSGIEPETVNGDEVYAIREALTALTLMLTPFAPHTAEELWEMLGHADGLSRAKWPTFDAEVAKADEVVVPVQINGKVRARLTVPAGATDDELRDLALADGVVRSHTIGKTIRKVVVAKGPLVSVVVQ